MAYSSNSSLVSINIIIQTWYLLITSFEKTLVNVYCSGFLAKAVDGGVFDYSPSVYLSLFRRRSNRRCLSSLSKFSKDSPFILGIERASLLFCSFRFLPGMHPKVNGLFLDSSWVLFILKLYSPVSWLFLSWYFLGDFGGGYSWRSKLRKGWFLSFSFFLEWLLFSRLLKLSLSFEVLFSSQLS